MRYYLRVLSTAAEPVPFANLKKALTGWKAILLLDIGEESEWESLVLAHANGRVITSVERHPVEDGSRGAEELDKLRGTLKEALPRSSAEWLEGFFTRVKCLYACQILDGVEHMKGWEIFAEFRNALSRFAPSILQADREGFTNEDGYHILWQYSDNIDGCCSMGLLVDGEWKHFEMDLADRSQREAFRHGEIPAGVKMA